MPTLFDTIAGSETGAIIASALVIPSEDKATGTDENNPNNKTNKNWAMDVKRWFYDNTDRLYKNDHVPGWAKFLIGIFFAAIFAGIGYKLAEKHYHDPHYDGNLQELKTLIRLDKKINKGKATDEHKKDHKDCSEGLDAKLTDEAKKGESMSRKNTEKFNNIFIKYKNIKS